MAASVLSKLQLTTPEDVLRNVHWTEANLAKIGIHITFELVNKALEGFWELKAEGKTGHAKKYVPFDKDEEKWTEGALVGFVGDYSGVKNIHFGRDNPKLGLPVSHADMFLRNMDAGMRLMTLECIKISDYRTGWFALTFVHLVMQGKKDIEVFVIGAGPVAEACILALNAGAAHQVKRVLVLSKSGKTNHELVKKLLPEVKFPLEATDDRSLIPQADYLITATNAGKPVVEVHEVGEHTKVLSQGIDDLPAALIERFIQRGALIVGDDAEAMEVRNVDPLALFYSRQGKKLTVHGKADGYMDYAEILKNPTLMGVLRYWDGPACFLPVGLAGYDIKVGVEVYKLALAAITAAFNTA